MNYLDINAPNNVSQKPPMSESTWRVPAPNNLELVSQIEADELKKCLAKGALPHDFQTKLARLAGEDLAERYIEQNCRWFISLLIAAREGSYRELTNSDREQLLRVLSYVRKEDDVIPDGLPGGYVDDQKEVREAVRQLGPVLQHFKSWHLQQRVPGMWSLKPSASDNAVRSSSVDGGNC
jgi:hypothetical protein